VQFDARIILSLSSDAQCVEVRHRGVGLGYDTYKHRPTSSEAAEVHCLVHCHSAEGMVCMRVFHVIGTSEAILVAWLPVIVHGTRVPILHIESAQDSHILIVKHLYDVGEAGCRFLNRWMFARGCKG
jgi:hypothetical protein